MSMKNVKEDTERIKNEQDKAEVIKKGEEKVAELKDRLDPDRPSTPVEPTEKTELSTIKTDDFELTLTNKGAGIQNAKLLKHFSKVDSKDEYVTLNGSRKSPIGALSSAPKKIDESVWTLKGPATATSVTYARETKDKLYIEKTFRLPEHGRRYEIEMELSIRNDSGEAIDLSETRTKYIYAGGGEPLHWHEWSMQMGLYYREDGNTYNAYNVDRFGRKKKILGIFGRSEKPYLVFPLKGVPANNLAFAGVNNQFFTTLIQAHDPQDAFIWGSKYDSIVDGDEEKSLARNTRGVEIAMGLPHEMTFAPGDQKTLTYDLYIGPKEAEVLLKADKAHKHGWKLALNYDQIPIFGKIFGWAIKHLAEGLEWMMRKIHGLCGNWGVAIILLTILVRLLMWPVYAKSARSMKRMSKLSPMMAELKEKYPDDPQKVQKETMKLYSKYNINPVGGCLPMFLQLPVFLGFYRMLWGAVELRHESFMGFVTDLTMPDNLMMLGSFPLNILPILMSIASFIQMAMTPKTGDNTQRMIFMMMPVMFLVFCYNFASGLALYWTISNVFTIFQTWLMGKLPEPELKESTKEKPKKKGWMTKLQDKLEEAQLMAEQQQQQKGGGGPKGKKTASVGSNKKKKKQQQQPQPGQSRTKLPSQKGSRHTTSKKKKRK